jgi:hypothetical protein
MPAGGLVTLGVGAAITGGEAIYADAQKKKALRQQEALLANRPLYKINPEEGQMVSLAESQAGQGLSDQARAQLNAQTNQQFASATDAALRGGADPNAIGNIAANSQNAYDNTALYDDQLRLQHLSNLNNIWARSSANKDKAFQINQEEPWKDQTTAAYGQIVGAQNMENSAINGLGSSLIGAGTNIAQTTIKANSGQK